MSKRNFRSHQSKARKRHDRRPDTGDKRRRSADGATAMEAGELEEYMNKGTLLRIRLGSNEEFIGRIEWYDQSVINLALADGSRSVIIFKHAIAFYEKAA